MIEGKPNNNLNVDNVKPLVLKMRRRKNFLLKCRFCSYCIVCFSLMIFMCFSFPDFFVMLWSVVGNLCALIDWLVSSISFNLSVLCNFYDLSALIAKLSSNWLA